MSTPEERINGDEWPVVFLTKAAQSITKADQGSDDDPIDEIADIDGSDMADMLTEVWRGQMQTWGDGVLSDLGVDGTFNLQNPRAIAHLKEFAGTRIKGMVTDTTIEELRSELAEGVAAGEGIDDLAARVESVFGIADSTRAERIARTEVIRSSNFATTQAYRESGVVEAKQWVATPDARTRDTHAELDGKVVGLDDNFTIDGAEADAPGDFGVPELDINCRCTVVAAQVDEPKAADYTTKAWDKFDKAAAAWEKIAAAVVRKAFRAQREQVLSKLRKKLG